MAADGPTEGLVAYWAFDETGGTEVKDSSGHHNGGRLLSAERVPGRKGRAIACQQDALVEVPHTPTLDEFEAGFTVSAWVKRDADATWNMILSREVKNGPSEYFGVAVVNNKALFSIDPDGAHYQNIKGSEDLPAGEWIHLAGTYDHKEFRLYVNGALVKSAPCSVPFHFADKNPTIIGGNTNSQGNKWVDCFHGLIDEVRLYNRALSEDEISKLNTAGGTTK
ncbi:MAG: LamG domain-containing protein [Chthoniobacteraceae bacterium]